MFLHRGRPVTSQVAAHHCSIITSAKRWVSDASVLTRPAATSPPATSPHVPARDPTGLAHGGVGANGGVDEDRLALRLRLSEGWRETRAANTDGISSALDTLVAQGRLDSNDAQATAAVALSQLPSALRDAREARNRWDAEQLRRTAEAKSAAARTKDSRAKAAAWQPGGWLNKDPQTPKIPAVVGPACWLAVGPPPAMRPAGCYIYGSVGTGKSTLMDLFCLFGKGSWRVRRQHFHEFSVWLHQTLHTLRGGDKQTGARQSHILQRAVDFAAEGTDILCLDEFAITNVADAAIFAELLKLFAERNVAVVCTTNRPPEDLYADGLHRERYVPALVARFREDFLVAAIQGADYREALLEAEAKPMTSGVNTADAADGQGAAPMFFEGGCADAAFRAALAGQGDDFDALSFSPSEIKVSWGRKLPVPGGSCQGVARFHFDDLCRRALGAEDYLHLAIQFHTVFVHDVPRLSLNEHNEARRFTNLVDALYEHSVRLVCHSQVPLEEALTSVETLREATTDGHDASQLGVFDRMYDDTPNFQIQIKELGSRDKWKELQDRMMAEEQRAEAQRLARMSAPTAAEGDTGSGWSAAPASADLSAPDQGVAGVMVAAVGSLQESGFAARRALSRLKEMQTRPYLEAANQRRASFAYH